MKRNENWPNGLSNLNNINFKRHSSRRHFHSFMKLAILVALAFISGACGAHYVIEERLSSKNIANILMSRLNSSMGNQENIFNSEEIAIQKNKIDSITSYIVGITASQGSDEYKNVISGVIVDSSGYIATSLSEISSASQISVKIASPGVKPVPASVVYSDKNIGLAILKIDMSGLPEIKLADSDSIGVGDKVIVAGNPLGEENSTFITQGIISYIKDISVKNENGEENQYREYRTDANISKYNDGGILCNQDGEIIGVISSGISKDDSDNSVGIAISIDDIMDIVEENKALSSAEKPVLGFKGGDVKSSDNEFQGVYVQEVFKGKPLCNAGIKPTDIILELDGKRVSSFSDITSIMAGHKAGDEMSMEIWRNGSTMDVTVKLTDN